MQQLCAVLQGCLSQNRDERNQAEALLKQVSQLLLAVLWFEAVAAGLLMSNCHLALVLCTTFSMRPAEGSW